MPEKVLARADKVIKMMLGKVSLAVLLLGLTVSAQAQQAKKMPRIGYLRFTEFPVYDTAFRKGLSDLGYIDRENIQVEYRFRRR